MLSRLAKFAAVAVLLAGFNTVAASAEEIFLRSKHSGKYVTLTDGTLAAAGNGASQALRLDMVRLRGGNVAFRSVRHNSYVRAGVGQGSYLAPGSPHIRGWETFRMMSLGNGVHALKSVQSGKLVRAGVGRGSKLAAISGGKPRAWEMFEIVPARAAGGTGSSGAAVSSALVGDWRMVRVAAHQTGHLVDVSDAIANNSRISIGGGGGLRASLGCNSISATVSQSGAYWGSSDPVTTKRGCPGQGVAAAERSLTAALRRSSRVFLNGRTLTLRDAGGRTLLVMQKR